jgi:hypothetical protein
VPKKGKSEPLTSPPSLGFSNYTDDFAVNNLTLSAGLKHKRKPAGELPTLATVQSQRAIDVPIEFTAEFGGDEKGTRPRIVPNKPITSLITSRKILDDLRNELARIVTQACLDSLQKIFAQAENQTKGTRDEDKAFSSNPLTLFDELIKQGGISILQKAFFSTGEGTIGAGNARIIISEGAASNKATFAGAVFAELVHVAGYKPSYYIGGTFSDVNLAKASYNSGMGISRWSEMV